MNGMDKKHNLQRMSFLRGTRLKHQDLTVSSVEIAGHGACDLVELDLCSLFFWFKLKVTLQSEVSLSWPYNAKGPQSRHVALYTKVQGKQRQEYTKSSYCKKAEVLHNTEEGLHQQEPQHKDDGGGRVPAVSLPLEKLANPLWIQCKPWSNTPIYNLFQLSSEILTTFANSSVPFLLSRLTNPVLIGFICLLNIYIYIVIHIHYIC